MNTCSKVRANIEKLVRTKTQLAKAEISMQEFLGYKDGDTTTRKELKARIQEYYDSMNLKIKAKATDIEEYADLIKTSTLDSNGKKINVVKIRIKEA